MKKRGRFIVVEGLEGAGKSTAIEIINNTLTEVVPEIILTREPGGTHVGEVIRNLIKEKIPDEKLNARSELLLVYAARTQLLEDLIRPALERGAWVIADRFELSTFAYQGWGRGLDINMIRQLSEFCLQSFKPDLIFYLDIDPESGLQRVNKRGAKDRIEEEALSFFNKVREGYLQMADSMSNVVSIDAGLSLNCVQESISSQLKNYLADHASL